MNEHHPEDLMSTSEVLAVLGISPISLHRYIKAGRIRPCGALRFEGRGKLQNAYRREDVERLAKENVGRGRGRPRRTAKEPEQEQEPQLPMMTMWDRTYWPQPDGTWRVDDRLMITTSAEQYDALEANRLAYIEDRIAALTASDLPADAKADIVRRFEEIKATAPSRRAEGLAASAKFAEAYQAAMKEIAAQKAASRDTAPATDTTATTTDGAEKRSRTPRRARRKTELLAEEKEEPP